MHAADAAAAPPATTGLLGNASGSGAGRPHDAHGEPTRAAENERDAALGIGLDLATAVLRALLVAAHDGDGLDSLERKQEPGSSTACLALLAGGRLAELVAQPPVAAAVVQALSGWRFTPLVGQQEPSAAEASTGEPTASAHTFSRRRASSTMAAPTTIARLGAAKTRSLTWRRGADSASTATEPRAAAAVTSAKPTDAAAAAPAPAAAVSYGEGAALLAAVMPDPRTATAWASLRGWSSESEPCESPGWDGVECSAGRVTQVVLDGCT